ncbi:hypothetical protein AB6E94_00005, partial [Vibrio lentus]
MQRIANPWTSVRLREAPPLFNVERPAEMLAFLLSEIPYLHDSSKLLTFTICYCILSFLIS